MSKATLQLLMAACLVTGTSQAASDPFVGTWKLNPSKSKLTDQMKVESLGSNRYAFDFGAGTETIVADGTDQPGNFGTTMSVTIESADTWKGVRKKNGRVLLTGIWKLSKDGNTLRDDFTEYQPDGSKFNLYYVYKRTGKRTGIRGHLGKHEREGELGLRATDPAL